MDRKIKLFCLPFAGASATIFYKWKRLLGEEIQAFPIELAGRGMRLNEPLYNNWAEMVEDTYGFVKNNIDDGKYAFFGHSMGSWLVYELTHKIIEKGQNPPVHIFFSGRRAPHINKEDIQLHKLPDERFKEEIIKLGGTPRALFETKGVIENFLPILKSDLKNVENYVYFPKSTKLNCNTSVFYGRNDSMTRDDAISWSSYTSKENSVYEFEGGHFFINDCMEQVVNTIKSCIKGSVEQLEERS